jgi:hypothetical protein
MMGLDLYTEIVNTIRSNGIRGCQNVLEEKYPLISTLTLGSILGTYVQRKMKSNHSKHNTPEKIEEYYKRYCHSVSMKEAPGIILRLSDEIQICPVLVARFILESYLREHQKREIDKYNSLNAVSSNDDRGGPGLGQISESPRPRTSTTEETETTAQSPCPNYLSNFAVLRQEVSRLLKDTTQIEDRDLAYEVYLCTVHDDHYGPLPDTIKQSIGAEYEQILKEKLSNLQIWFVDENVLRKQGYDKTPDFKLEVPIAISGQVINWIESKALFGDEETHRNYLEDQYISYWNRFGPGLVIYWLGHVDTLNMNTTSGILIRDQLPDDIVHMKTANQDLDLELPLARNGT